ncbi:MAG: chemotaxis protein CheW [Nitrospirae bacterium]|nr:chemotaxis protein CheW [Nitrospirota bacterium]
MGGRRLAAKVEEVGGVWPWTEAIPVPSGTAFVSAVVRRGEDVLPVFDLAGKLDLQVVGPAPLCLIAKRVDGPMAVRIDADIPTLHTIEETAIRTPASADPDLVGVCVIGTGEVPIYSLATLGRPFDQRGQSQGTASGSAGG